LSILLNESGGKSMTDNNQNNKQATCEFCKATENDKPIFTTDYQGRKLLVCARCLPGLIHG
jgi:hypothetical protein